MGGSMNEALYSILVGTAGLSVAAVMALLLTLTRKAGDSDPILQRRLMHLTALTIVLQGLHFAEEWVTGFYKHFPELLGLRSWSVVFFVSFNLFWLVVWVLSAIGLRGPVQAAFFPIWFLGIGCIANGLAHPLFSLVEGGYFPGLWTSPLVGVAGILLLRALALYTQKAPLRVASSR